MCVRLVSRFDSTVLANRRNDGLPDALLPIYCHNCPELAPCFTDGLLPVDTHHVLGKSSDFDFARWADKYFAERSRYACWLLIDVPNHLIAGESVSVTVFPHMDRRDLVGAWADDRYRSTGYEPPRVLFGELLEERVAHQLAAALAIVKRIHNLTSSEALGFLVNLFVLVVDLFRAQYGRDSLLFGTPGDTSNSILPGTTGCPVVTPKPLFAVSNLITVWQEHSRFGVDPIYVSPGAVPGRMSYKSIPPSWLTAERLKEVWKPGDIERTIPMTVDIDVARLIRPLSESLSVANELFANVDLTISSTDATLRNDQRRTEAIFRRHGKTWELTFDGDRVVVRHRIGLIYLSTLLKHPNRLISSVELANLAHSVNEALNNAARGDLQHQMQNGNFSEDFGHTGHVILDERAKAEFRARLSELDEEFQLASSAENDERASAIDREREFLLQELSRATGIGGRNRYTKSTSERSRTHVSKAIKAALGTVEEAHPTLAYHLKSSIKTGAHCVYQPTEQYDWAI